MTTAKKQFVSLGMLLLVALPLFFSIGSHVKQQFVKHQRRNRFKTEKLETVTIKADSVDWVKAGKEIQINGKLFDIKSFKINGANIMFTGFFDSKEDKLVKHIRQIEQHKNKSGSSASQLVAKFLFLPNYKESAAFSIQNHWLIIVNHFAVYKESLCSMPYPAVAPPPKYC